ncbi:phosphoribosylformylglycinamidine synthase subunit PurS [Persicitalea jodogahamensis]|uniref:Phosphoribosylformylglycinamidine synthase subunit PurS n=1 Tax=Persicitalea jodogahamensis TaxID=402147 RepID=A0A8J3D7I6_9BACT|nr:phosphoribosylformylglycinamidine synthase subunit PurS [Persicitalea jodogahamensis]GHB56732.1 phosphoribosylformylglycinamidine synthase subunit PurS [Persicitalea jodogahamensis]
MQFAADINIMPIKEILDPQGKAVKLGLHNLGIDQVDDVRIGKHITIRLEAADAEAAEEKVKIACEKLLANLIMEEFSFEVHPVQ